MLGSALENPSGHFVTKVPLFPGDGTAAAQKVNGGGSLRRNSGDNKAGEREPPSSVKAVAALWALTR